MWDDAGSGTIAGGGISRSNVAAPTSSRVVHRESQTLHRMHTVDHGDMVTSLPMDRAYPLCRCNHCRIIVAPPTKWTPRA